MYGSMQQNLTKMFGRKTFSKKQKVFICKKEAIDFNESIRENFDGRVKHEGGGQINWYYRDVLYTGIDSILWMKGTYRILIDRGYVYGMDVCHLAFGRGYFEPPNRYNALPGRFYKDGFFTLIDEGGERSFKIYKHGRHRDYPLFGQTKTDRFFERWFNRGLRNNVDDINAILYILKYTRVLVSLTIVQLARFTLKNG